MSADDGRARVRLRCVPQLKKLFLRLSSNTASDRPLAAADIDRDVNALLRSSELALIKRFFHQPFWESETQAAERAAAIEGRIRLESVADHSWKVADAVILLIDHFPTLDRCRAIELAVLHDKLELLTGDISPIDADATGTTTHAFNEAKAREKKEGESSALEQYLATLRPSLRQTQRATFADLIYESSVEARFVKAVDKLSSLVFVIQAKRGCVRDEHVRFTAAYSAKAKAGFPGLAGHYDALLSIFLEGVQSREGGETATEGIGCGQHRPLRTVG
jgi:5'-deoxynucleotidase YfbR-like HD superfamily hydrolase